MMSFGSIAVSGEFLAFDGLSGPSLYFVVNLLKRNNLWIRVQVFFEFSAEALPDIL